MEEKDTEPDEKRILCQRLQHAIMKGYVADVQNLLEQGANPLASSSDHDISSLALAKNIKEAKPSSENASKIYVLLRLATLPKSSTHTPLSTQPAEAQATRPHTKIRDSMGWYWEDDFRLWK